MVIPAIIVYNTVSEIIFIIENFLALAMIAPCRSTAALFSNRENDGRKVTQACDGPSAQNPPDTGIACTRAGSNDDRKER
jgi:hypothetical protein